MMKKKTIAILAACALAIVLAAGAGIGRAYAYFTSYVEARGVRTIHLGDWSEIDEDYTKWHKDITLTNKADSYDAVYVRAKAFVGAEYSLVATLGDGWSYNSADEFYYYDGVLAPGQSTTVLAIDILGADGKPVKVNEDDAKRTVNVVVIYETTPAVQNGTDEAGNIIYEEADWNRAVTKTQTQEAEEVTTAEGGND